MSRQKERINSTQLYSDLHMKVVVETQHTNIFFKCKGPSRGSHEPTRLRPSTGPERRSAKALPSGSPRPGKRVDSPVGEMPGECPGAAVPQDEAPKLQQRGCSGSSVSTCDNREESVTKVNTGFWRLRKAKWDENHDTGTPNAKSPGAYSSFQITTLI